MKRNLPGTIDLSDTPAEFLATAPATFSTTTQETPSMNLRYRKKPIVVEAFHMSKERFESNADWPEWMHEAWNKTWYEVGALSRNAEGEKNSFSIRTLEGRHIISEGDWIIKGIRGELYPCKTDIFDATYEAE